MDDERGAALSCPRLYGEAAAEVIIASLEEGLCLSEVLRRRHAPMADDADVAARATVAGELARAFWNVALGHGLVLGGLSASNLLLRSAGCDNELEVVSLRCGLAHEINEQMKEDLRAFARCLAEGPEESVGGFLLERVHLTAGGDLGAVRDVDGFASGVRELAEQARAGAASQSKPQGKDGATQPPLRGAVLLQQALALAKKHGVRVGPCHLQVAAAVAGLHGICSRLDPIHAGRPLFELQGISL